MVGFVMGPMLILIEVPLGYVFAIDYISIVLDIREHYTEYVTP